MASKGETINIYARLRKIMQWEDKALSTQVKDEKTVINRSTENHKKTKYEFTKAFDPSKENKEVFEEICVPMLDRVLEGFNGIFIAYGQTGSGKTHSVLGPDGDCSSGILPLSLDYLLNKINVSKIQMSAIETFGIHVSKTELYDLCNARNHTKDWSEKYGNTKLDPKKSERIIIENKKQARETLKKLYNSSHVAPTGKNPVSSRGHVAYIIRVSLDANKGSGLSDTMQVERRLSMDLHSMKGAYWVVVDLAGSEGESALTEDFIKKYKEQEVQARRYEAWCINHGLSQLQMIFNELRRKGKLSKLVGTGLRKSLHPFINANSNVSILFTISPSKDNSRATESTLRFAELAAHVRTSPVKATIKVNKDSLIKELQEHIQYQREIIDKLNGRVEELESNISQQKIDAEKIKNEIPEHLKATLEEYEKLKQEESKWNARESQVDQHLMEETLNKEMEKQMDESHLKLRGDDKIYEEAITDNEDNNGIDAQDIDIGLDDDDATNTKTEKKSEPSLVTNEGNPTKVGDPNDQSCKCVIL